MDAYAKNDSTAAFVDAAIRWPHLGRLGANQPWTLAFELAAATGRRTDRQKAVNRAIADERWRRKREEYAKRKGAGK